MIVTAISFAHVTGCRPSEAAYVVTKRKIAENDYFVKHMQHAFKATAPAEITKTSSNYFWLLESSAKPLVDAILEHESTGFPSWVKLKNSLRNFFAD